MALKVCRECERQVSTDARTCPHCGAHWPTLEQGTVPPQVSMYKKNPGRNIVGWLIVIVLVLVLFASLL